MYNIGRLPKICIGKRTLCFEEQPGEVSQYKGRTLPCSHAAELGEVKKGSPRLSYLQNQVTDLQSNHMWWERYEWDSFYPQLASLLDKWVLEKPSSIHTSLTWSVFQAHRHPCSLYHSAPLRVSWRSSWPLPPLELAPNHHQSGQGGWAHPSNSLIVSTSLTLAFHKAHEYRL